MNRGEVLGGEEGGNRYWGGGNRWAKKLSHNAALFPSNDQGNSQFAFECNLPPI